MMNLGTLRRYVKAMMGPLESRLQAMVVRAVIESIDDSKLSQLATLHAADGEAADEIEHPQPYGLSFRPTAGSEAVVLSIGSSAYRVALSVQNRDDRPTTKDGGEELEPGEGGLYFMGEFKVFAKADGTLALGSSGASDAVALAPATETELDRIRDALSNATPGAMDGGAALLASIIAGLGARGSIGATKVTAE